MIGIIWESKYCLQICVSLILQIKNKMKIKICFLYSFFLIFSEISGQSKIIRNDTLRFGVFTDIQYCSCDASGSRFYKNSIQKTKETVDVFNNKNLSFVVHLGDLIDRDVQSYDSILPVIRKLKVPIYFAYGNHDFNIADKWKDSINSIHQQKNAYYAFTKKDWLFVVLNTNDISTYAYPKSSTKWKQSDSTIHTLKNQNRTNTKSWNGGIGDEQLNWLNNTLKLADSKKLKVILFGHHPFYPPSADNALNDIEIISILKNHPCVKAYFCGHNHKGNFSQSNKIYYLNQKGMVESNDSASFSIIKLTSHSIDMCGFGLEKSRKIPLK